MTHHQQRSGPVSERWTRVKLEVGLQIIITFAELTELDVFKQHTSLDQIEPVQNRDFFRLICGNCKIFDHYEHQCPRLHVAY